MKLFRTIVSILLFTSTSAIYADTTPMITTQITSQWTNSYCMSFSIKNTTNSTLSNWKIRFNLLASSLRETWNGNFSRIKNGYEITPLQGISLGINENITLGFCSNRNIKPTNITFSNPSMSFPVYLPQNGFAIKNNHNVTVEVTTSDVSGDRYCRNIRIINKGKWLIESWRLSFDLGNSITGWNGRWTYSNGRYSITPESWNRTLLAWEIKTLGFCTTGRKDGNWKLETSLDNRYYNSYASSFGQSTQTTTNGTTTTVVNTSNVLYVWTNRTYRTIASAVNVSWEGNVIYVDPGVYYNEDITINRRVHIIGNGGTVRIIGNSNISNGKAFIVTNADTILENISFENATVSDRNGAGVRYQSWSLLVKNCSFIWNQEGILSASNTTGRITIENSRFDNNGYGDGYTHGVYVWEISNLTISNSTFTSTKAGHHIKSRAATTSIQNNTFDDINADTSYHIDIPNGGIVTINGNTFTKWINAQNQTFISYGAEGIKYSSNILDITNNTFRNFRSNAIWVMNFWWNTANISNNTFINVGTQNVWPGNLVGNTIR